VRGPSCIFRCTAEAAKRRFCESSRASPCHGVISDPWRNLPGRAVSCEACATLKFSVRCRDNPLNHCPERTRRSWIPERVADRDHSDTEGVAGIYQRAIWYFDRAPDGRGLTPRVPIGIANVPQAKRYELCRPCAPSQSSALAASSVPEGLPFTQRRIHSGAMRGRPALCWKRIPQ